MTYAKKKYENTTIGVKSYNDDDDDDDDKGQQIHHEDL